MPPKTEAEHRDWLAANARDILVRLGVQPGQTLLDFGCGPGRFCIPAAGLVGAEGRVFAVDKSGDALSAVAKGEEEQSLVNVIPLDTSGDVKLSVPDASCDHVVMFDVLQLIDDWEWLFSEGFRALKPGGQLTVFPLHVDASRVRKQVTTAGFTEGPFWRCLLRFHRWDRRRPVVVTTSRGTICHLHLVEEKGCAAQPCLARAAVFSMGK
jgi:ubiquinone/menaquinone biosynthesis C-methylase UbiE